MNFEYIIDYEVYGDCGDVRWGTFTTSYNGTEPPDSNVFAKEVLANIGEKYECDPRSVRIKGVFKL